MYPSIYIYIYQADRAGTVRPPTRPFQRKALACGSRARFIINSICSSCLLLIIHCVCLLSLYISCYCSFHVLCHFFIICIMNVVCIM